MSINWISKTVLVTAGPYKGFVGKVVQSDKGELLVENPNDKTDRRFIHDSQVVADS